MKTYRNVQKIEKKEQRGRRLSMTGLGILIVGLLASFVPTWLPPDEPTTTTVTSFLQQYWMWISFIALPTGFIFASTGSFYINRFARRRWKGSKFYDRPDELLERSLKGFDNKYAYFAWSLPANYAIVGPCGVIVVAARSDKGRVTISGENWREPFSISRIFTIFAREGLGNPAKEVNEQASKLTAILADCTVDGSRDAQNGASHDNPSQGDAAQNDSSEQVAKKPEVPISGAAVFLNPEVDLTVENPGMPVLRADQLKEFIRRQAREVKMQTATVRAVTACLVESAEFTEEE